MLGHEGRTSRRNLFGAVAIVLGAATVTTAGAATYHRYAISNSTGSGGATAVVQSSLQGSAFQGNVGTPVTGVNVPFGLFGVYNGSGSTLGVGAIGLSKTGYGVAGASYSDTDASVLAYPFGKGVGLEALTTASSTSAAIYADAKGSGDGGDFYASGAGSGLYGQSAQNFGLFGINTATATPGPTAPPYTSAGTVGESSVGPGIYGTSTSGNGVLAVSQSGFGAVAFATGGSAYAIYGESDTSPGPAPEVPFQTYADTGVFGNSYGGPGVVGNSDTPSGGLGALGLASGEGVVAQGYSKNAAHPALSAYDSAGGSDQLGTFGCTAITASGCAQNAESFIVQSTSGNRSNPLTSYYGAAADVQVSGDLYVFGKIYAQCGAFPAIATGANATKCYDVSQGSSYGTTSVARSSGGSDVNVYSAVQSVSTIEDLGQAQLVDGRAYVRLDPAFARTTEPGAPYMVFVTPEGDSRGVFTTSHSLAGFEVRENAGGRSTMTFDYRIVAKPLGDRSQRFVASAPRRAIPGYHMTSHAAGKPLILKPRVHPTKSTIPPKNPLATRALSFPPLVQH